jgi:hypothetical protein
MRLLAFKLPIRISNTLKPKAAVTVWTKDGYNWKPWTQSTRSKIHALLTNTSLAPKAKIDCFQIQESFLYHEWFKSLQLAAFGHNARRNRKILGGTKIITSINLNSTIIATIVQPSNIKMLQPWFRVATPESMTCGATGGAYMQVELQSMASGLLLCFT